MSRLREALEHGSVTEKTLIYGTSYIDSPDRAWLIDKWGKLALRLNPGIDILIVNTPAVPNHFPSMHPVFRRHDFADNIGHLRQDNDGQRDGWGRAMCWGAQYAMDNGYTNVALIECLLLFAESVTPIFTQMRDAGKTMAQPHSSPHNWMESALTFMDVNWLRAIDFPTKYDWPSMVWSTRSHVYPEHRLTDVARQYGKHMQLEMLGCRDEVRPVTEQEAGYFDWLTHSKRATYEAFLRGHGHGDLL